MTQRDRAGGIGITLHNFAACTATIIDYFDAPEADVCATLIRE